ncbi:MAG TPA: DnaA N-terminal domain-containing protein, partial [Pirellulales bacterium]|nr:DnaA N-terminal domain-containing protein [Pirellulales bacterium]
MDDKEIVSALRACLADKVGQERFDLWFVPHTRLSVLGHTIVIEVANVFFQNWIRTTFRREIEAAGAEVMRQPVGIEFRIDAAIAASGPPTTNSISPLKAAAPTVCGH